MIEASLDNCEMIAVISTNLGDFCVFGGDNSLAGEIGNFSQRNIFIAKNQMLSYIILMNTTLSRKIVSNQTSIHEELPKILARHRETPFQKPIAQHSSQAFEQVRVAIANRYKPLILDSGCGTGESTILLARMHPKHFVIGVDKSLARLSKNPSFHPLLGEEGVGQSFPCKSGREQNFLLIRANLIDFWRLAVQHNWQIDKHYLLYPNPWPKKKQLKRRFHGHPVFFDLIRLGHFFELRSNWQIYVQEFAFALEFATGIRPPINHFSPKPPYISRFEKKYAESGHELFRLIIRREK